MHEVRPFPLKPDVCTLVRVDHSVHYRGPHIWEGRVGRVAGHQNNWFIWVEFPEDDLHKGTIGLFHPVELSLEVE